MYAYIKGRLTYKSPTMVYVESGGIGYTIHISLNTYGRLEDLDNVRLFTHLHVKEDDLSLYGFFEEEEKRLFELLISVSGIGPNTARIILSSMTHEEVVRAIVLENDIAFKKVKGVGPKTAKRLILDLKDKIQKTEGTISVQQSEPIHAQEEAMQALLTLGFQKNKIQKVLQTIPTTSSENLEEIIKIALQKLSTG
jgi:Holliday junction DNA helicase RuvA